MSSQPASGLLEFQPSRLNEEIDRRLLTTREVAQRLGVTYKTVDRWRKGQFEPRRPMVRRMAEEFGVDPLSFYDIEREAAA